MTARNKCIAGKFEGKYVTKTFKLISVGYEYINKDTVEMYELITEDKRKSGTSAILRGASGAALLGPIGTLAGVTAKTKGIYLVAILWKNGEHSLLEVDDNIYKGIVTSMF